MNTSGSGYMPQPLRRTTDEPVSLLVEVFVYDLSAPTQVFDEPVSTMRESSIRLSVSCAPPSEDGVAYTG